MNKIHTLIIALIFISFLIGAYFYPQLPEQMASHWDAAGNVNGYMPKFWGVFFMPIFSVFIIGIFFLVPKIDPLKENIARFHSAFDGFILVFEVFFIYLYVLTVAWNLGVRFNMAQTMSPAMGILFYYMGFLIENAKPNWFVGIRTPWTLSSEDVWTKTHRVGAKLFKASGVLAFFGIIFPDYAIVFMLVPVLSISVYLFIFSYFQYKKEGGHK